MNIKNFILILLCVLLSACASARRASELQDGKLTFAAGNYQSAFHKLLPLAIDGEAQAQYAVGYMYYNGLGVSADPQTGIAWMNKSAAQHYQPAMQAMEELEH